MKSILKLTLFFSMACFPAIANAGFDFMKLSESSTTDPSPPLTYGDPVVTPSTGATVVADFNPQFFAATSNGPIDLTDGRMDLKLTGVDDAIWSVSFFESGAVALQGTGSTVSYGVTIVPTITALGGVATNITLPTMTASGSTTATDDAALITNWSETLTLDLLALGYDNVSMMEFNINNTLLADAVDGGLAFIDKKDFKVSAVPEPSSFLFLGAVLTGASFWNKRRTLLLEEAA